MPVDDQCMRSTRSTLHAEFLLRCSCHRMVPLAGGSRPHSIRSRLVFPLPLGPVRRKQSPGRTAKLTSRKIVRFPRTHSRCDASSMSGGRFEYRMKLCEDVIDFARSSWQVRQVLLPRNACCLVFDRSVRVCEIEEAPSAIEPAVLHRSLECDGLLAGGAGNFQYQHCAFGKLSGLRKLAICRTIHINIVRKPGCRNGHTVRFRNRVQWNCQWKSICDIRPGEQVRYLSANTAARFVMPSVLERGLPHLSEQGRRHYGDGKAGKNECWAADAQPQCSFDPDGPSQSLR